MNREFFLNILFLVVINLLIKPVFIFGIDLKVQNLTNADYGLYFSLLNLTYITQIIGDFGIQNYNSRFIARYPHLFGKYYPILLGSKGLLLILFAIVTMLCALVLQYPSSYYPLLAGLIVNQALLSLIFFFRSAVAGLGYYRLDSLLSVLDKLLMIGFFFTVFAMPDLLKQFTIHWFVWGQTVALFITALLSAVAAFRYRHRYILQISLPKTLFFLRESLPYALVIFLMYCYTRTDGVLIERLLPDGAKHASIYAAAFRLLDALNMVAYLFSTLLLPMFSKMLTDRKGIASLVDMSYQLIMTGGIAAAVGIGAYRFDLMALLYHANADESADALFWLMGSFLAFCTFYIYGTLLTAYGAQARMNRIFVIGIVLNVGLNLAIIPYYHSVGAAAVSCITQVIMTGSLVVLAHRLIGLRPNFVIAARLMAYLAILVTATILLRQTSLTWQIQFLIFAGTAAALSLLLRLINVREMLHFAPESAPLR